MYNTLCPCMCTSADPAGYRVSLNATTYSAKITADTKLQTPVIFLSVLINNSAFNATPDIEINLQFDNTAQSNIFKLQNGATSERHYTSVANTTTVITTQILYVSNTSIAIKLPQTIGMNISVVFLVNGSAVVPPIPGQTHVRVFVTLDPPHVHRDYCQPRPSGPCDKTGSLGCNLINENTTYSCDCVVGFTGYNCSQDIDECESIPVTTGEPACFNDGNCTNLLFGRFE